MKKKSQYSRERVRRLCVLMGHPLRLIGASDNATGGELTSLVNDEADGSFVLRKTTNVRLSGIIGRCACGRMRQRFITDISAKSSFSRSPKMASVIEGHGNDGMFLVPVKVGSILGLSGERDVVIMCKPGEEAQYSKLFSETIENQKNAHRDHVERLQGLINGR